MYHSWNKLLKNNTKLSIGTQSESRILKLLWCKKFVDLNAASVWTQL